MSGPAGTESEGATSVGRDLTRDLNADGPEGVRNLRFPAASIFSPGY